MPRSLLGKMFLQTTALFLVGQFLCSASIVKVQQKGKSQWQSEFPDLSCCSIPGGFLGYLARNAHTADSLRWCVLGFLLQMLPGEALGFTDCKQRFSVA